MGYIIRKMELFGAFDVQKMFLPNRKTKVKIDEERHVVFGLCVANALIPDPELRALYFKALFLLQFFPFFLLLPFPLDFFYYYFFF